MLSDLIECYTAFLLYKTRPQEDRSAMFNLGRRVAMVVVILGMVLSNQTAAQNLRDYRCKIERVAVAESPPNTSLQFQEKNYIGREFTVERRTGLMAGALKNSYITRPEVVDFGSADNSYKVVTTLRKEQGEGRGSNAYLLVVNEYAKTSRKPFVFVENDSVYFGTCTHF